ncbi:MAG: aspartyl protease family protein [Candidatus Omnitrophica bacterium]|nr:aspartyl protease family protein [Candidatus Omnitrophota bacterium]
MNIKKIFLFMIFTILTFGIFARGYADVIYLKNGKVMEGLIQEETDEYVMIELGFGSIKLKKEKIKEIKRAEKEEVEQLKSKWEIEAGQREREAAEEMKRIKEEEERNKQRIKKEFEQRREEQQKASEASNQKISRKVIKCIKRGNALGVEALLNGRISVELLIDTGATDIFLNQSIKNKLGMGISWNQVRIITAGEKLLKGKCFVLKSVRVGEVELKNIDAVMMFDSAEGVSSWDGVLGMSFFKNFKFNIDYGNRELVLEGE